MRSEVQEGRPGDEALPQRKPPKKDALRQQQTHRARPPVHEVGLAGGAVSTELSLKVLPSVHQTEPGQDLLTLRHCFMI